MTANPRAADAAARPSKAYNSSPSAPESVGWRRTWPGAALIAVAVLFIYWPAIRGGWLWDDEREIAQNPVLRDPAGLLRIWRGEGALDYFPLKATVQWALWHVWGNEQAGWHLASIALHLASALLLWRLLWRIGVRHAWLGGFVFAIHPLAVESVAWIAELKNTLSLPLALLSFLAWLDYDAHRRRRDWWRALALFAAALLCKTSVILLPFVFGLHAWWKHHDATWRRRALALLPFLAVAVALGLVTIVFQHQRAIGGAEIPVGGVGVRIARAGLALAFYVWKSISPVELMPVYPRWSLDPPVAWMFLPWLGFVLAAVVLWRNRSGWGRSVLFSAGAFGAMLAPILGFVGMAYMHVSWVADHFAYAALPAMAGLVAAGVDLLVTRIPDAQRKFASTIGLVALALWLVLARTDASRFRSAAALWSYAANENPGSALAQNNLGNAFLAAGEPREAALRFAAAIRCDPQDPGAHINLGHAFAALGRGADAIREHQTAVALAPASALAANSLGGSFLDAGRLAEARAQIERALQLDPAFAEAHNNLGIALARSGDIRAAARQFEIALQLNPALTPARTNLEAARGPETRARGNGAPAPGPKAP